MEDEGLKVKLASLSECGSRLCFQYSSRKIDKSYSDLVITKGNASEIEQKCPLLHVAP